MSIFGSIVSAIFGSKAAPSGSPDVAPSVVPDKTAAGSPGATASTGSSAPMSRAQVEAQIAGIAEQRGGKFNWQHSIVDLMKLLDLDSSLAARKELAQELGYKGALDGSAEMNIWLHQQVMEKLAASGGKVPESMRN